MTTDAYDSSHLPTGVHDEKQDRGMILLTRSAQVVGVDINPSMQIEEMPDNVHLQVDDLNRRLVPLTSLLNATNMCE